MTMQIKLTKQELKYQKVRLAQLVRYLPILKLRKALLELKVISDREALAKCRIEFDLAISNLEKNKIDLFFAPDFLASIKTSQNPLIYENVGGVRLPIFNGVNVTYDNVDICATPFSLNKSIDLFCEFLKKREELSVMIQRITVLERALRKASIRSNLIEKVLIPRTESNISKIKVFLMDLDLASIGRSKMCKAKKGLKND